MDTYRPKCCQTLELPDGAIDARSTLQSKLAMGSSVRSFGGRFWALIGATFLGFLGMGTVLPLVGPHVRNDLGASDQAVGLVIGIFSFVALAGRLISGPLADRRGRKFTFLAGLASCGLAGLAYSAALRIGWRVCRARAAGLWRSVPVCRRGGLGGGAGGRGAQRPDAGIYQQRNLGRHFGGTGGGRMAGLFPPRRGHAADRGRGGLCAPWRWFPKITGRRRTGRRDR